MKKDILHKKNYVECADTGMKDQTIIELKLAQAFNIFRPIQTAMVWSSAAESEENQTSNRCDFAITRIGLMILSDIQTLLHKSRVTIASKHIIYEIAV